MSTGRVGLLAKKAEFCSKQMKGKQLQVGLLVKHSRFVKGVDVAERSAEL
jgi:hypothetical protein